MADRVSFEAAYAGNYPGGGYDLVGLFESRHDMGDPVGARTVKRAISKNNARGPNIDRRTYNATLAIDILAGPLTTRPGPELPGIAASPGS